MKLIIISTLLSIGAMSASAGQLTCWYNAAGEFTGADGGTQGVPEDQWNLAYAIPSPKDHGGGDYAYVMILKEYNDGNDCPKMLKTSAN